MSKFSKLIRTIKEKLFDGDQGQSTVEHEPQGAEEQGSFHTRKPKILATGPSSPPEKAQKPAVEPLPPIAVGSKRQQPYFIQVGFDFGTSFCKCICRDVMTDKAWVHIPPKFTGQELPFLIPSAFLFVEGKLQHFEEQGVHYPEGGLYHLKHALVKVALGQLNDPVLEPYWRASERSGVVGLQGFVESCAIYFLAGGLGTVREQVRQRMPDFGSRPDDYMAVNIAVPVADAEQPSVNNLYHRILCEAWFLADEMSGYSSMDLNELESLRQKNLALEDQSLSEACFIYPEVSANVQGFVRSRVSSPGIYLFSDTGAGTVDQSAFIFFRPNNIDHLTYLHGHVLPCGSSHIEFQAAKISGGLDPQALDLWRERKERGSAEREMVTARNMVAEQLIQGTEATLARAKGKLYVKEQINDTRVIFGGGGHCEHPYKTSVIRPFSGQLFRRGIQPDVVGLPIPIDLDLDDTRKRWMRRLAVAYGLSFEKSDLVKFTYPRDVKQPEPEQLWPGRRELPHAPTKDQC